MASTVPGEAKAVNRSRVMTAMRRAADILGVAVHPLLRLPPDFSH
jgi:hypothetical protein